MRFINVNGVLARARRYVSRSGGVQDEEVRDPVKLAELIRQLQKRVTDLESVAAPEGIEFEVNCGELGESLSIAHNFGGPVRYYVTHWAVRDAVNEEPNNGFRRAPYGVISRACSIGTWANTAAGQSNGVRYRMLRRRNIIGIRYVWVVNAATTYNIRAVLWNDSTGAVLNEVTGTANATGLYEVFFSSPTLTDLTGVDIVTSIYETGGTRQVTSGDGVWKAIVPVRLGNDMNLVAAGLIGVGNVRPTVVHGGTTTSLVEPIFAHEVSGPELVVDKVNTTSDKLVLKSYTRGRAVIRIEPAQAAVTG